MHYDEKAQLFSLNIGQLRDIITEIITDRFPVEQSKQTISKKLSQMEAADFLGISVPTLIEWKKKGLVPYHQVEGTNRVWYYEEELLEVTRRN